MAVVLIYVPTRATQRHLHMHLKSMSVPRLMMGNLLIHLSVSEGTKAFAKGSSKYPTSTALSRETLASLSVFCTIASLAARSSSVPAGLPRRDARPPRELRSVLRFGICEAAIQFKESRRRKRVKILKFDCLVVVLNRCRGAVTLGSYKENIP